MGWVLGSDCVDPKFSRLYRLIGWVGVRWYINASFPVPIYCTVKIHSNSKYVGHQFFSVTCLVSVNMYVLNFNVEMG